MPKSFQPAKFVDLIAIPNRDTLMPIIGSILAFDDLFDSYHISNQASSKDFDPTQTQTFVACIGTEWRYEVWGSGKVIATRIAFETIADLYATDIDALLLWCRSQPIKQQSFFN